ncbi:MAG: hypothetical protein ACOC3Z_00775 [Nanoarchaeota archaeon]
MDIKEIYKRAFGSKLNNILEGQKSVYYGENWRGVLENKDIIEVDLLDKHGGVFPLVCKTSKGVIHHADVNEKNQWDALEKIASHYTQ